MSELFIGETFGGMPTYKCSYCPRRFILKRSMLSHQKWHKQPCISGCVDPKLIFGIYIP